MLKFNTLKRLTVCRTVILLGATLIFTNICPSNAHITSYADEDNDSVIIDSESEDNSMNSYDSEISDSESIIIDNTNNASDNSIIISDIPEESLQVRYNLKVSDKDRVTNCPGGNPNVNSAIEEYALSLDGAFPNFYFYHEQGDYKAMQCCSMANHTMYNIFGEDMYDIANRGGEITSENGQNIYEFLLSNNAKSGDILFSSYIVNGKIRPHYIVINGYNEKGIWFTDGYAIHSGEKENSPTVIAHISSFESFDYTYFKNVSGTSPNKSLKEDDSLDVSDNDIANTGKGTTYWKLYPVSQTNWETVSKTKWVKGTFTKKDDNKAEKDSTDSSSIDYGSLVEKKRISFENQQIMDKNALKRRKHKCNESRESRDSAVDIYSNIEGNVMSQERKEKRSTE